MLVTAYPAMLWLVREPSFTRLLPVELWLSFIYGSYNGAMVVFLTEIMPIDVRTSGFALAYSLATAIFGGFTPAISTYLIHVTEIPRFRGCGCPRPRCSGSSARALPDLRPRRTEQDAGRDDRTSNACEICASTHCA